MSRSTRFALLLLALLALVGCRREVVAPGDPVAAVKGMAAAVRENDLVRFSRLSVPPELHKRMEARWHERLKVGPAPTAEQQRDYARWMQRLTARDAEQRLYQGFDSKLRKVETELGSQWPLMQATGGIFVNGLIQSNDTLSPSEKEHAKAVGSALLNWLTPARVADRDTARQAIAVLAQTARELDLDTLQDTRRLEMVPALEKGGKVLRGLKRIGQVYGLDADASLGRLQATLVAAEADQATVKVSYPLLEQTVSFDMQLLRRDGRWYSADAVKNAEAELLQPLNPHPLPTAR